ncbi:MAG: ribosome assembly cofactor RimP [Treponema sp.]|jgi:ribosome maturation factor RimP|nr:ribosome assembly cofactor RimP [Treponema sp.]
MRYTPPQPDSTSAALEPIARGLKLSLVELTVFRRKGSVQVRIAVYNGDNTGLDDCSAFHHAALPRLQLAFPGQDLYIEVSSPGTGRLIRDGAEFRHYTGRHVRCYRTDTSAWFSGLLCASDEREIVLQKDGQKVSIPYEIIAKAQLDEA